MRLPEQATGILREAGRRMRWSLFPGSLAVCEGCGKPARWRSRELAQCDDWCDACVPRRTGAGSIPASASVGLPRYTYSFHPWSWSRQAQVARTLDLTTPDPAQTTRPFFEAAKHNAAAFNTRLAGLKTELDVDFPWYPYETLANFVHFDSILSEDYDFLFEPGKNCADFGAADGALSFYMESLGHRSDIYDYPSTNMNGLRGAKTLKAALDSSVGIFECDLDRQFVMAKRYDVIFFLGLLYHLKNPFYVLEQLSGACSYMFLSTRVARHFQKGGEDVSKQSAAYLLGPEESNNDATNFWIFTHAGLKRLLHRSGWDIVGFCSLGCTSHSNPQDDDRDERAFALLKSRVLPTG